MNIRPTDRHLHPLATKVLFVDYGIGFGGAVISMSELVNKLAETENLEVFVLSAQSEEIILPLLKNINHIFFPMPINYITRDHLRHKITRMGVSKTIATIAFKVYALIELAAGLYYRRLIMRAIKANKIDLVHLNNAPDVNTILTAKRAGVPCIVHCRGLEGIDKKALAYGAQSFPVRNFVAISNAVADFLRNEGIPDEKIRVIPNPVDWDKFDAAQPQREIVRTSLGLTADEVVVAIFGRITEWKGQLEFLQAIELIISRCANMKIMIVGDSSDDVQGYQQKVQHFSQNPKLRGRVIFAGYQEEVFKYYWASDLVIHNSLLPEPFGRVIIEAMACRRPVIAMDEGGPIDIIKQNHDGVLIPPRDTALLAHAIERLYNSEEERARLGQNAGVSAREQFGSGNIAKSVRELYETVLATPVF